MTVTTINDTTIDRNDVTLVTTVILNYKYLVPSESNPDEPHIVLNLSDGLQCDCDSEVKGGRGRKCWHKDLVNIVMDDERKWQQAKRDAELAEVRSIMLRQLTGR